MGEDLTRAEIEEWRARLYKSALGSSLDDEANILCDMALRARAAEQLPPTQILITRARELIAPYVPTDGECECADSEGLLNVVASLLSAAESPPTDETLTVAGRLTLEVVFNEIKIGVECASDYEAQTLFDELAARIERGEPITLRARGGRG